MARPDSGMCPEPSCDLSLSDPAQSKSYCRKGSPPDIAFPCELLALAYSAQGQALLDVQFLSYSKCRCNVRSSPVFGLELENRERLVLLLKGKGLDLE
jgi:hypothetical protein